MKKPSLIDDTRQPAESPHRAGRYFILCSKAISLAETELMLAHKVGNLRPKTETTVTRLRDTCRELQADIEALAHLSATTEHTEAL